MELSHVMPCIDCHVAGSPVRVLTGGLPRLRGGSARELADDMRSRFDWLRTAALLEPRGASNLIGAASFHSGGGEGEHEALFMDASGYPDASITGALGLVTVMRSTGSLADVDADELVLRAPGAVLSCRVEPSGSVSVAVPVRWEQSMVGGVSVLCGRSDAEHCIVRAEDAGVGFEDSASCFIDAARDIQARLGHGWPVSFWWEDSRRLVTVAVAGTVSRGPDGGAAAVLAAATADGEFGGLSGMTVWAGRKGDVVEVRAWGRIISLNYLVVDPEDPVKAGFILG